MKESDLQAQVADYLRLQYPDVLFHSDFGSGVRLTPSQAVKQKRQNGGRRAWPDMFIAEVRIIIPRDFDEVNKYAQNHWVCFPHKKGGCIKPAMVVMVTSENPAATLRFLSARSTARPSLARR